MKVPFLGMSYQYGSLNFDAQRSVNIFPTSTQTAVNTLQPMPNTSKDIYGMQLRAGLSLFCNLPDSPIRGSHQVLGRCFVVAGYGLYQIFSNGTYINRGSLLTNNGIVAMADNGLQLCIVDGTATGGWIFTLATNVFAQITAGYFLGSYTVTFIDGYFVFVEPNSQIYYLSASYDGTTGDPLQYATAGGSSDNLVAVIAMHEQLYLFGTNSIEVDDDLGSSSGDNFPFVRNASGFIEYGCIAYASIAKTKNTLFWLGNDNEGNGVVWAIQGYQPIRISTYAVEFALSQYASLSDAVAYCRQDGGHYFYCLNFTGANTTWVYDIDLGMWHEEAFFNLSTGMYERGRPQNHVFAFNQHLVGDYVNGNIYVSSLNTYTDNGNPIRWMRTAPHIADDLEYVYYNRLQIDMQSGTGLPAGAVPDVSPQIMLRWSDDGGYKWSNEHLMAVGAIGNYKTRVYRNRLGRARDRVFQISGSTNTKTFLIAAHIDIETGTN